jgi:hypothetical protein
LSSAASSAAWRLGLCPNLVSMSTQVVPAVGGDPFFFYRPFWNEHKFLRSYPQEGLFDAAILRGRHLAPHPAGSTAAQRGESGRELANALHEASAAFVVDPDTPILAAGGSGDFPSPRVALMPHAQVLGLPLSRISFVSPSDRRAFVGAAVAQQAGAQVVTAPYFAFERRGGGWYALNLDLIADTAALDHTRPLAAFVHAPVSTLVAGDIGTAAPDYASLGVDLVFLRFAGLDPQTAGQAECRAYRAAVDAFAEVGVPAVADAVGRFGLVLSAAGAAGFSSGALHHKFVAENVIFEAAEEMRSAPIQYEVPHRWYELTHTQARADARRGLLPACPVTSCGALLQGATSAALKEHMVHYFTHEVRTLAQAGAASARAGLTQYPRGANVAWTAAL